MEKATQPFFHEIKAKLFSPLNKMGVSPLKVIFSYILFLVLDLLPLSRAINVFVEEGQPLRLNCTAMAEVRDRLGDDANFDNVEVLWEMHENDGSTTKQSKIYQYW